MKRGAWRHLIAAVLLAGLVMAACGSPADTVGPVERQQIQNVVKDYWTRNSDIPDYTANIDALTSSWARVSIHPAGVSSQNPVEFYLHKELGQEDVTPVPTAQTDVSVASEDPVTTSSGWTIVLGPKASFTAAELDAAGVPQAVRP
jgi:hypothetical protein